MTLASTLLLTSFPMLINMYAEMYRQEDLRQAFPAEPADFGLPVDEVFDFVIVGGGTAGLVLARRLSDAQFSVVVLEAGGTPPPLQSVPLLSMYADKEGVINFLYNSTKQKNAALVKNGRIFTPAAKMLGGGSSHNDMMYERGSPINYDEWADITGDQSWAAENFLHYFKKAEQYMGDFPLDNGQHGTDGLVAVSRPSFAPGRDCWLQANVERGFTVQDANGPQKIGASPNEYFKRNGRRESSYTAYIKPIEKTQKNLSIRRYSLASQVIFEGKTAVGVLYKRHGVPRYVRAAKEVILSAGAYISPIILIKSGIGPKDQLKAANVPTVAELPVGFNLMDHPFLEIAPIYVSDPSKAWNIDNNLTFQDVRDFIDKGEGPLTSAYLIGTAETFFASSRAINVEKRPDWADLQIYYEHVGEKKDSVTCYVGFNRPYSRGRLTLNTTATEMDDPYLPLIDYNYFGDETDFDVVIDGINFCLDTVEKTQVFKSIGARYPEKNKIEECKHEEFRSKEYWKCYIRYMIDSTYHASGVCRMGKKDDPNAVVDSKLRVLGVNRLRVCDASIFPTITNANTASPTMAIAEKTAAEIIREYKR